MASSDVLRSKCFSSAKATASWRKRRKSSRCLVSLRPLLKLIISHILALIYQ